MLFFTLTTIKIILFSCYLFAIFVVILFSWLYLMRTIRATKAMGLQSPEYLKILVRISIANAIFTALLITFFLLTNIY